jgi:hypothetical protein
MRNFILGVIITLVVLILGGMGAALLGLIATNANATPPNYEARLAMSAVDASTDRHAAHTNSPVLPSAENLIDGMKIYTMNCSICHGTLDQNGSITTWFATVSAIPGCPPGTRLSPTRTSGRSPSSSPTCRNYPRPRRIIGRTPSGAALPALKANMASMRNTSTTEPVSRRRFGCSCRDEIRIRASLV